MGKPGGWVITDDLLFSPDVNYRGTAAMKLSSRISKNFGDEPANGKKGVVSSAKQGLQAPITSSKIVRINGSWAIRDGDRFEMDKASVDGPGNTIGEGTLKRDVAAREAPTYWEIFKRRTEKNSQTVQDVEGAGDAIKGAAGTAQRYWNVPSL